MKQGGAVEFDSDQIITPLLERGETLLWSGKPESGLKFRPRDVLRTFFGTVWVIVISAMLYVAIFIFASIWMVVIDITCIALGCYIYFGPLIHGARRRGRVAYGLSDKQVFIVSRQSSDAVKKVALDALEQIVLEDESDGSGSILLEKQSAGAGFISTLGELAKNPRLLPLPDLALEHLLEASKVYEVLLSAQRKSKKSVKDE